MPNFTSHIGFGSLFAPIVNYFDPLRFQLNQASLLTKPVIDILDNQGEHAHNLMYLLLQLSRINRLTPEIMNLLLQNETPGLTDCIHFLSDTYFNDPITHENLSRLLSSPSIIDLPATIFQKLLQKSALSEHNLLILTNPDFPFEQFSQILYYFEPRQLDTAENITWLIHTPWMYSDDAVNAIWSRLGFLESHELEELKLVMEIARRNHRETPIASDFIDGNATFVNPAFLTYPLTPLPQGRLAARLDSYEGEIPPHFICPLSQEIMDDPVCIDGEFDRHVFERTWIENWLQTNDTNPINRNVIANPRLIPATDIANAITEFIGTLERDTPSLPPPTFTL